MEGRVPPRSPYNLSTVFVPQKVPLLKISDGIIACDLWFEAPQSKILATPMQRKKCKLLEGSLVNRKLLISMRP